MSDSSVKLLFYECNKDNPDMRMIDEYISRCCNNKEDINSKFPEQCCHCMSPFHMACCNGHHEIVMKLLENSNNFKYPIDINAVGGNLDETPIHLACRNKCPLKVRRLLLHPKIEVNKANNSKDTPLHTACWFSRERVVIELLKHRNINTNVKNYYCHTPLHKACSNSSIGVVELLLDHGTIHDINAMDVEGDTPLHKVCCEFYLNEANINIIRNLLRQQSIIINKKNNNDETPLQICKRILDDTFYAHNKQYYIEMIQLLQDYQNKQRWRAFYFFMNYDLFKSL